MSKRNWLGCVALSVIVTLAWAPTRAQEANPAAPADAAGVEVHKDVPYVPTPEPVVDKMIELAKVTKDDVAYDFGCGDGRLVIAAVKAGAKHGLGVDIDPQRIKEANENAKAAGVTDKVDFQVKDLFTMDFKDATVLTMYLLPSVNMRLRPKILDEMKPGSRVVSHAFDMEDWEPEQTVTVEPGGQTVYMWTVPAKVEGMHEVKLTPTGPQAVNNIPATLNLKQAINKVTGTAKINGKESQISDGKLVGNTLTFGVADDVNAKYTCTIESSGTVASGDKSGESQPAAAKQGGDAAPHPQQPAAK
jgi:SAM-dependent methyltransferase